MNKQQVVLRAWAYYHAITAEYPEARNRATLSECFRAAWRPSTREQWEDLNSDGSAALAALSRMIWKVKAHAEAQGRPSADWIRTSEDARSAAGEAWSRVPALLTRAEQNSEDTRLPVILYRAAASAVMNIYRTEHQHPTAALWSVNSSTGAEHETLDLSAAVTAEQNSAPEHATIIRDCIDRAALDGTDRAIIAAIMRGYTIRQIAAMLNISKSAAQRRLDAIRNRIVAQLAA